jgi:hypothetical protein
VSRDEAVSIPGGLAAIDDVQSVVDAQRGASGGNPLTTHALYSPPLFGVSA